MKKQIINVTKAMESNLIMLAIRHALTITIPVLMIGSIACFLNSLPIAGYQTFITTFADGFLAASFTVLHKACFNFFSIFIVINISISYMMEYTSSIEDFMITPAIALTGFFIFSGAGTTSFDGTSLSVNNTFVAISSSLIISVVVRRIQNIGKDAIKTGTSGGMLYHKAIDMILPTMVVMIGCTVIMLLFRRATGVNNFSEFMTIVGTKVVNLADSNFLQGIIYMLFVQVFWFFGVHGGNVMESVSLTNFSQVSPDTVFSKTFYDIYINMGGCGTALCIVVAIFIAARHESSRSLAKGTVLPVLCNINELVIFGFPIVFNPVMGIPFLLVPLINYTIAYLATACGLVPCISQAVEWTTPVFLSGYTATGSLAGSALQLICLVVGVLIYMPFVRLNERVSDEMFKFHVSGLVEILKKNQAENMASDFLGRKDVYEATAKTLIADLKAAIQNKELFMVYQPQINNENQCIGAEALIRWNHKVAGFIYPPLIIELAKEGGLLEELERFIFDDACRVAKRATEYLGDHVKISLNITATSLRETIVEEIDEAVRRHGVNPQCIWIEITENDVLSDTEEVTGKLRRLKDHGHKMLIDDFSMGNTSLKYLKTECFDGIKLDAAITKDVKEDYVGQEIISMLTELGKRLDIYILAEYVEDQSQREVLEGLGCDFYQGYLYSKPLEEADFMAYIQNPRI